MYLKAYKKTTVPNVVSVTIKSQAFTGFVPKINVLSAGISSVELCDLQENIIAALASHSVDEKFHFYLIAKDDFKNKVALSNDKQL